MYPNEAALNKLISRIVEEVHPVQIILFGSGARGEMRQDSDLDIMVVMPDGVHRRSTAQKLYRTLSGFTIPFEFLVVTSSDLEKYKDNTGLIYHTVLLEGKQLYAA